MQRGLIAMILMVLTLGLLLMAGSTVYRAIEARDAAASRPRMAQERVFAVNVKTVQLVTTRPVIETFGEVISGRSLELRTAAGGELIALSPNFHNGGTVMAGEILFQTDPSVAQANLKLAENERAQANAELQEAKEALILAQDEVTAATAQLELRQQAAARQASLRKRGVGTEAALETARLAQSAADQALLGKRSVLAQAKARINRAEIALSRLAINLDENRRKLAETTVVAAFDGVLSDVSVVLGGLVNANERLGSLIDLNALEVSFRLSNQEFSRLPQTGADMTEPRVTVLPVGSDREIPAVITRVNASVGEGQTGREVFATLDRDQARFLRPGDFTSVRIEEPPLVDVAVIPAAAANASGDILLLTEGDRLEELRVEILRKQGDFLIVKGDIGGREIILARTPQLGAGIAVRPLRKGAQSAIRPETIRLSDDQRQAMIAFVQANTRMPQDRKALLLQSLAQPNVPVETVARLRSRMGG